MDHTELGAALTRVAALGAYFEVCAEPTGPGWTPIDELAGPVLASRVDRFRHVLAKRAGVPVDAIDLRAGSSTDQLALLSRLLAPALGTAALAGLVAVLTPGGVQACQVGSGPAPIAWTKPAGRTVRTVHDAADALTVLVVNPLVTPLVDAYRTAFGLSPQVTWGNAASALAQAAGVIERSATAVSLDASGIVDAMLARGPLAGTGRYRRRPPRSVDFARQSCCLFYRVPGGGLCGDCVLA